MKTCSKCKRQLDKSNFNKNKTRPDGLQLICRNCDNKRSRDYYLSNRTKQKIQINSARRVRTLEIKEKLWLYYLEHPCIDCGESDPIVLESDHLRDKTTEIAKAVGYGWSWNKIEKELAKCVTRCANCHRRKTSVDFGWYRYSGVG